ncbi:hypothetical protein [Streptomyces sp. NPDC088246]|uniref:hypothetical protein n=1 Tax=Streptomyces sp. NPDC088246 TaxID=3365842 RepID=UPI00380D2DE0
MPERPYTASAIFVEFQNVELAAEAVRMARIYADMTFIRAANPESPLLRDWSQYVMFNEPTRYILDWLLVGYAVTPGPDGVHPGFEKAREVASKLEAFSLVSSALECQTFAHTSRDGQEGYLIAVSAITSSVMANICWGFGAVLHCYELSDPELVPSEMIFGGFDRDINESTGIATRMDEAIFTHLQTWGPLQSPFTPIRSIIPIGTWLMPKKLPNLVEARRIAFACQGFLLAHELTHVIAGDVASESTAGEPPRPPFLSGLPPEVSREAEADYEAFRLTLNSLVEREGGPHLFPDPEELRATKPFSRTSLLPRKRGEQRRVRKDLTLFLDCVESAVIACLSFYAVVDLLSAVARHRGLEDQALRFEKVADRRNVVRGCVRWYVESAEEEWGVNMRPVMLDRMCKYLDRHILHLKRMMVGM